MILCDWRRGGQELRDERALLERGRDSAIGITVLQNFRQAGSITAGLPILTFSAHVTVLS